MLTSERTNSSQRNIAEGEWAKTIVGPGKVFTTLTLYNVVKEKLHLQYSFVPALLQIFLASKYEYCEFHKLNLLVNKLQSIFLAGISS